MKILIADDQTRRYARFLEKIQPFGVDRGSVDLVPSANDARTKLESNRYDLLILDVMLPAWPESEPDVQSSLDLLFSLHETNDLQKPNKVIGITADISLIGAAKSRFNDQTWHIVEYSESNDDWLNSLIATVAYLQRQNEANASTPQVDLVVICALPKPELEQVLKLPWDWKAPEPIDNQTFVHRGAAKCGDKTISVAAATAPRMGMVASALLSARLISILKPKLIIMCGICAGVKGKTDFGDILVADPAWDFQSGKRIRENGVAKLAIAPHQLPCSARIRSHLEQLRDDSSWLQSISSGYELGAPRIPKIIIGPVASGSAVLADSNIVEEIKSQHRAVIGVEMEAYGMYAAATEAGDVQPAMASIKAVCDFADTEKADDHQRFAAFTSASTLKELIQRFGERLIR